MNISYNWLKNYINIDTPADELSKILTSIGLEVGGQETIHTIKGGLEGLVVGEVLTCGKHENADKLSVTTVDIGTEEPLPIVCGAPNIATGQKVIVATVGTTLYDGEDSFLIKKSKIRGEVSCGMICAEDEIGIGSNHDGIIVLPSDTPIGTLAKDYYGVETDIRFEVDITPNRADATSHYGVARDIAAYYALHGSDREVKLTLPTIDTFEVDNNDLYIPIRVENSETCPRYAGITISNVQIKPSPSWLKNHLLSIGLRPINNVVDVTNFILHELGQPLHAFDADKISHKEIMVRTLPTKTKFITLDGEERDLDKEDLMICNGDEPMCIAGVFGGISSGVTENTHNIFLESAYFNPVSIRKTAKRHALNTDASFRFERGIDPNITLYALKRAAILIKEVAGGYISSEPIDLYPRPIQHFSITLEKDKIDTVIGKKIPKEEVEKILKGLEIEIVAETTENYQLKVPPYRVDVQRDVDVIEDLLRIYGYNNVENDDRLLSTLSYRQQPDTNRLQTLISEQLTSQGMNEVLNNSLTKEKYYTDLTTYPDTKSVKLLNALSTDLQLMRQTLLFGGLENIRRNVSYKQTDLKLYEFGNCYQYDMNGTHADRQKAYKETYHLGIWITGNNNTDSWLAKSYKSNIFELKAYFLNILERMGVDFAKVKVEKIQNELISTGLKYTTQQGMEIGYFGVVSPKAKGLTDVKVDVFYADLYWDNILSVIGAEEVIYQELSKYPEVKRDFAFLLDKKTTFAEIEKIAFDAERKLLKKVTLFDVYEGEKLEKGKKSYAINFILQDVHKTLTDKVINKSMNNIRQQIEQKLNAKLRD